jgi:hypothetical protein
MCRGRVTQGVGIARCPMRFQPEEGTTSAGFLSSPAEPRWRWDLCERPPHWMEGDAPGFMLPCLHSRVSANGHVDPDGG